MSSQRPQDLGLDFVHSHTHASSQQQPRSTDATVSSSSDDDDDERSGHSAEGRGLLNGAAQKTPSAAAAAAAASVPALAQLGECVCKVTPFNGIILLIAILGLSLLIPGVMLRLDNIPSPHPPILMHLCKVTNYARTTSPRLNDIAHNQEEYFKEFRTSLKNKGETRPHVLDDQFVLYSGSSQPCAGDQLAWGSSPDQVFKLPDQYLLTGLEYVLFLALPSFIVGGQMRIQLHSGSQLIVNSTVELHTYHFSPSSPTSDILFLPHFHVKDMETAVWNPLFDPPLWPSQPDCRNITHGCPHRMRYGMHSLVLTRDAFTLPRTKDSPVYAKGAAAAAQKRQSSMQNELNNNVALNMDGNMLEHKKQVEDDARSDVEADEHIMHWATNLTLSILDVVVIESPYLAREESRLNQARLPLSASDEQKYHSDLHPEKFRGYNKVEREKQQQQQEAAEKEQLKNEDGYAKARRIRREIQAKKDKEAQEKEKKNAYRIVSPSAGSFLEETTTLHASKGGNPQEAEILHHAATAAKEDPYYAIRTTSNPFAAPDIILSFHQYGLSSLQANGVTLIIRGLSLILLAIALTWAKLSNSAREKQHYT